MNSNSNNNHNNKFAFISGNQSIHHCNNNINYFINNIDNNNVINNNHNEQMIDANPIEEENYNNKLTIMTFNIRGFGNVEEREFDKLYRILNYINKHNIAICAIQETHRESNSGINMQTII